MDKTSTLDSKRSVRQSTRRSTISHGPEERDQLNRVREEREWVSYIVTTTGIRLLGNMIRAEPDKADRLIEKILLFQKPPEWLIRDIHEDRRFIKPLIDDLVISISDEYPLAIKTAVRRLTDPVYRSSDIDLSRFIDTVVLEYELSNQELIDSILDHIVYPPYSFELAIQPSINLTEYSEILSDGSEILMRQVMHHLNRWHQDLYGDEDEYNMLEQMRYRAMRLYTSLINQGLNHRNAAQYLLASILDREELIEEVLMDPRTNRSQIRLTKYRTRLFDRY